MSVSANYSIRWVLRVPRNRANHVRIWAPEDVRHDGIQLWPEPHYEIQVGPHDESHETAPMTLTKPGCFCVDNLSMERGPDCLEIHHSLTNLTDDVWNDTRTTVCVQLATAADFHYTDGEGVFYSSVEGIRSFPKELRPANEWACEFLVERRVDVLHPLIMVPSRCGRYTMGHAFLSGTKVVGNGAAYIKCIHSCYPEFGVLKPGETKTQIGVVFVVKGSPRDAQKFYLEWKQGAAAEGGEDS